MTAHDLHDALNFLPSDLLTAADRIRTAPKANVIPWRKWAAMAAVCALVIGTTMIFSRRIYPYVSDAKLESAAQAPAAAAPMAPLPAQKENAADEAAPEEPAAAEPEPGSASNSATMGGEDNPADEELGIDHSHRFAEKTETIGSTEAYCGNTVTTVYLGGGEYSFGGTDSIVLTKILKDLPYDPAEVCRCMAEFTVDTEWQTDIEVNLTQAFARCELGQAALTEEQVQVIRQIIEKLS